MKRVAITLNDVADWHNLAAAARRASVGKRFAPEVRSFLDNIEENLAELRREILNDTVEVGRSQVFRIRDPKPRVIHAPCFRERVLHHALMYHVGPVLDRALIDDTFACRVGLGALAAVKRCQHHVRRYCWYAKMDIRSYFSSISHTELLRMLERKFRDRHVLQLMRRIVNAHADSPGTGLPIGALTSQCFANFYLGRLDRFLTESCGVRGYIRYMDDFAFWADSRSEIVAVERQCRQFLKSALLLEARPDTVIDRSNAGVTICGYRVFPGTVKLAASRRRRFRHVKGKWEDRWRAGLISSAELQRGYAAAHAITLHADAGKWRAALVKDVGNWHDDV